MRQGAHLFELTKKEISLLAPINQQNGKKRRALLLLHGFGSSPAVYRFLLPFLSCYDAVICPVLPGHAEDLESFSKITRNDWLLAVEQQCEMLQRQFNSVDVMGLSLGGLLACHLSQRFTLNHLYLLAPAIDLRLPLNKILKLFKVLKWLGFNQLRSTAGNLYASKHCEIAYRKLPLSSLIEILTLIKQFHFSPPSCPTDVFLGRHDKVVASELVAARFAHKKNITIHWLAHSAHVLPLDTDMETIAQCVQKQFQLP